MQNCDKQPDAANSKLAASYFIKPRKENETMNSMKQLRTVALICMAIAAILLCVVVVVNSVRETGVYSIEAWIMCGVASIVVGVCTGVGFKDERIAICGAGAFAFLSAGIGLLCLLISAQTLNPEMSESAASNAINSAALMLFM